MYAGADSSPVVSKSPINIKLTREAGSREARAADAVLGLPRPFLDRLQIIRDDWGRVRCR